MQSSIQQSIWQNRWMTMLLGWRHPQCSFIVCAGYLLWLHVTITSTYKHILNINVMNSHWIDCILDNIMLFKESWNYSIQTWPLWNLHESQNESQSTGFELGALACNNPTLPLAAGVWSERSDTSHSVSQVLPCRLIHKVLHSWVVECPRLPGATPNQTEGRITDDQSWHIRWLKFTLMCWSEFIGRN